MINISLHIRKLPPATLALVSSNLGGGGYFGVNFGQLKSEVFHGGEGYFGVNFGQLKSEGFHQLKSEGFHGGEGYFGVNFGQLKSEGFHGGRGILE